MAIASSAFPRSGTHAEGATLTPFASMEVSRVAEFARICRAIEATRE
jgi:hypothetical protein